MPFAERGDGNFSINGHAGQNTRRMLKHTTTEVAA